MSLVEELVQSPKLFPIEREHDGVLLAHLDEAGYRRASFLDQRLLEDNRETLWMAWRDLEQVAPRIEISVDFIFHAGHGGSTLLARLLGAQDDIFALREPAMLRPIALDWCRSPRSTKELDVLLRLFSRTWRPRQRALIKATSFVSEIAPNLLALAPRSRAIVLGMSPANYLRVILGGAQSRREIKFLAAGRISRLEARLGVPITAASEGEVIAMSWLCETLCLHQASELNEERTLWLDFDRLLAEPAAVLMRAFNHLNVRLGAGWIDALVQSDLMHRYSKGPQHAYDANLRRQVMAQAEITDGAAVRMGMDALQRLARSHATVMAALHRVAVTSRSVGS